MKLPVFFACCLATPLLFAGSYGTSASPVSTSTTCENPVFIHLTSGSLEKNLRRSLAHTEWQHVVWHVQGDYQWVGDVTIKACNIETAIGKVVQPYPITAVFYQLNHVVLFQPRRPS